MITKRNNKAAGFTLPELMVSMVIAAIVMAMAIGIYIDMKKQYIKLSDKHKICLLYTSTSPRDIS
ncbi:PilW family protein, partial [Francisella tularensis]|uniref:PilW family protein n=1 Tax=Francisella tularensis TaxID=263 RepID=UPI001C0EF8A5